jgi:hypothetical protein
MSALAQGSLVPPPLPLEALVLCDELAIPTTTPVLAATLTDPLMLDDEPFPPPTPEPPCFVSPTPPLQPVTNRKSPVPYPNQDVECI